MIRVPLQNESLKFPDQLAGFRTYLQALHYGDVTDISGELPTSMGLFLPETMDLVDEEKLTMPKASMDDPLKDDDILNTDVVISNTLMKKMKGEQVDTTVDEFGARTYTNDKLTLEGIKKAYELQNRYTYNPVVTTTK